LSNLFKTYKGVLFPLLFRIAYINDRDHWIRESEGLVGWFYLGVEIGIKVGKKDYQDQPKANRDK